MLQEGSWIWQVHNVTFCYLHATDITDGNYLVYIVLLLVNLTFVHATNFSNLSLVILVKARFQLLAVLVARLNVFCCSTNSSRTLTLSMDIDNSILCSSQLKSFCSYCMLSHCAEATLLGIFSARAAELINR